MFSSIGRSTELCGWGRYPRALNSVSVPETIDEAARSGADGSVIMRGEGRSYGDAAMLTDGLVMLGKRLNRLIKFDDQAQLLTAEAGVTIEEILREFVPRGWFPAVTPGTKYVSLGGCVAADVHGKNHHRDGAFGAHVTQLELVLADGRHVCCSTDENAELFWATVGGLGLTGIIAKVTVKLIQIESAFMVLQHQKALVVDA
jgi:decaprenylphospho-beta-D-ribofuranose 2-oxidase